MKRILAFAIPVLAIFILISCKKNLPEQEAGTALNLETLRLKPILTAVPQGLPISKDDLDNIVIETLERNNDFSWDMVDFRTRWSAIQYGDQSVAIGYKPTGVGDITNFIHKIDLQSESWKKVHDAIIDLVVSGLNAKGGRVITARDVIVEDDEVLPIITFRLADAEILTQLFNLENVRYLEPLDYWPDAAQNDERSSSGCSGSSYALNVNDYTFITPNAVQPWNYTSASIPGAWSSVQGAGITIGVIDAGISSSQSLLNAQFNTGDSNVGRTVTTDYTYGSSAFTTCTHGTSMCGLAAGPRNNNGATSGVAYKSNLHFIRACDDVILDESAEKTGVKNALVKMGNKADVKIVSMSVGSPFYSSVLYDGVVYAYNQGKMIMAAAGTSLSWTSWWGVVYPAVHTQCIAVTGVKENSNTCATCHDGSEVDFTITMERNNNSSRNSLSLMPSGYTTSYIGGSSCATATAAGIAGLVWSVNQSFTRAQVLNFLTITSQYYPAINGNTGYGKLNAAAAVAAAQSPV